MKEFTAEAMQQFFFSKRPRRTLYLIDKQIIELLTAIKQSCCSRIIMLPCGAKLWRAQLGHAWSKRPLKIAAKSYAVPHRVPYRKTRMTPLPDQAEGRLNPKGVPCLYLARSQNTAMSEVRPWRGEYISIGQFRTTKSLRLVDCTSAEDGWLDAPTVENAAWGDINDAFAKPVIPSDPAGDYIPTQIIAELFRRERFDGVQYRSSIDVGGINIALFNPLRARCEKVHLSVTRSVAFDFGDEL